MGEQHTLNGKPAWRGIELDEKIKRAVAAWREKGYEGANEVTKRLLNYWFLEEHIDEEGRPFSFWNCQREAVEALIYVYEVCKYRSLTELIRGFDISQVQPQAADAWPKYAFKMATGSGKTFVMELAVVWQYFNSIFSTSNDTRYSRHFLILAPNLIVFDRLKESFEDTREIRHLPFIPPEWRGEFDLQVVFQSERTLKHSKGILFLTNIQQLYEREEEPINPIDELLGPKPRYESDPIANWEYLYNSLIAYEDLMIINDEAHHVHSQELKWSETIKRIDEGIRSRHGQGLVMQLDFSATPKDLKGKLFPHIIYDYPLRDAIRDKKVKRPRIGILEKIPPAPKTSNFILQHKAQIDVGVQNLLEFKEIFKRSGKKPVLFIMTDSTKHADEVGRYLEGEKGFRGRVLVIHTDREGNITKKDLPMLREAAKNIDRNQYEVIVSVMMLKEGWDVRNVVVIVPLRPFKSELLPEQTLGRGLRRMFPHSKEYEDEPLILIDHPRFRQLWNSEIERGNLVAEVLPSEKVKPTITNIYVVPEKRRFDISIPIIEGGTTRRAPNLEELEVSTLPSRLFQLSEVKKPEIRYREKDLLTQRIVREKMIAFDYTDDFDVYLSYVTSAIVKRARVPTLFSPLVPKVEDYIVNHLFTEPIEVNREVVEKLNDLKVREVIVDSFALALTRLSMKEEPVKLVRYFNISDTQVLHTSKPKDLLYEPSKSVFNILPADSQFEIEFMSYLDKQPDVLAYTKILREAMPLHILYYDDKGYLHYYTPDFIVKTEDCFYIVETKGERYDAYIVRLKDKAAKKWCESSSEATNSCWKFVKIMYRDFQMNSRLAFNDLVALAAYEQPRLDEENL